MSDGLPTPVTTIDLYLHALIGRIDRIGEKIDRLFPEPPESNDGETFELREPSIEYFPDLSGSLDSSAEFIKKPRRRK